MTNCTCGKETRLRAVAISFNRRRGVSHWIEHMDGTGVCLPGHWACGAFKPYPKDESQRESRKLIARWEATVSANAGATPVAQGAPESA